MGKSTKKRHLTESYKQYMRKYYKEHRDILLSKSKAYNQEHDDEIKKYAMSWRDANRERISKYNKKYYLLHKDDILEKSRAKRLEKSNSII